MQECHPERSEGSPSGERSFAALRMTKRDGLLFEMYWALWPPTRNHFIPIQGGISYVNSKSGTTDARAGDADISSGWYCVDTAGTGADRGSRLWPERIGAHRSATCHLYQQ